MIIKSCLLQIIWFFHVFCVLLFSAFWTYAEWCINQAPDWGMPFPEGTQILEYTDTHTGIFRRKGTMVIVAQIPEHSIQTFADKLVKEEFYSGDGDVFESMDLFLSLDVSDDILDSSSTLYIFDDATLAFSGDMFSDWNAAIFDLETGLYCIMEYDVRTPPLLFQLLFQ